MATVTDCGVARKTANAVRMAAALHSGDRLDTLHAGLADPAHEKFMPTLPGARRNDAND